jgi:hypothetical protein
LSIFTRTLFTFACWATICIQYITILTIYITYWTTCGTCYRFWNRQYYQNTYE